MQTEERDGFLLDRGFHVMQTGYTTVGKSVDFDALGARPFRPGARVISTRNGTPRLSTYADPFQAPLSAFGALRNESLFDLLRILRLRSRLKRLHLDAMFDGGDGSTRDYLHSFGFSAGIVDRFFRPLFAGIFLESELATSERMFRFVFAAMARGRMVLPANGIQALPDQLADQIGRDNIEVNRAAEALGPQEIRIGDAVCRVGQVVVAHSDEDCQAHSVWTLHFDADSSPAPGGFLMLNGDYHLGRSLVAHLAVPSDVQPAYAPGARALVTVTAVGDAVTAMGLTTADDVETRVRRELANWFPEAADWRTLAVQKIHGALPRRVAGSALQADVSANPADIIRCGDHELHGSVEGAFRSAEVAADAARQRLNIS
jgi:hypothetical protein